MVAGSPEPPFILLSIIITGRNRGKESWHLYGCPSHTQASEGLQLPGTGCQAAVCARWPLPLLLDGKEILERRDVSPGDIPNIQQTSLARGVTLGERGPDGLQMCKRQLQGGERGRTCSREPHFRLSVT